METHINYLILRRNLGFLGVLLPIILVLGNQLKIEPSISHYYYTYMNWAFTGFIVAFGIFLISYKGYEKEDEALSDNILTNISGLAILLVAIIPTQCYEGGCDAAYWHQDPTLGAIHNISAGIFLLGTAWICIFNFRRGDADTPFKRRKQNLYLICGIIILAVIATLGILFALKVDTRPGKIVFYGEFIALLAFGTAWLVKGEALEMAGMAPAEE